MKSVILLFLFTCSSFAANWYVRPNGGNYGSSSGRDWNNAWTGLGNIGWSGLAPGDTVWVAGGTYTTGVVPNKSGTSASPITVARARSDTSACINVPGWNSSFDSLVTQRSAQIAYEHNMQFVVISGRITASGGAWGPNLSRGKQCGWLIDMSALTQGNGVAFNAADDNMTIEYVELQGAGQITVSGDHRGIDMTPPSGTASGNTFSHLWIHDWESGVYCVGASSPVFEYLVMEDIAPQNTASYHPNGIIIWGCPNGTVRYSIFRKGPHGLGCGEGVFFEQSGGSGGWNIYGNVFAHLNYVGLKAIEVTSAVGPLNVYNNTFIDILVGSLYTSDSPSNAGGNWKNNLNYQSGNNSIGAAANNMTAADSGAFVNFSGNDFHLTSGIAANYPRNKGVGLTTDGFVNKDMDGNVRGADGAWDVGAFEYVGTASAAILVSPTSLNFGAVAIGNGSNLTFTVQNAGVGTLSGSASVAAPFSIVSGGSYSLGSGQSQTVTVRYSPAAAGSFSQPVILTGGGGAVVSLNGSVLASVQPPANFRVASVP